MDRPANIYTPRQDSSHHNHLQATQITRLLQDYGVPLHSVLYTIVENVVQESRRLEASANNLQLSLTDALHANHELQSQYDGKLRDFNVLYGYHSSYKSELETVHLKLREAEARIAFLDSETGGGAVGDQRNENAATHSALGYEDDQPTVIRLLPPTSNTTSCSTHEPSMDANTTSALRFPYHKKEAWLTRRLMEVEQEKSRLAQVVECQRRVVDKVWEEMACAPGLELALRQAQRLQGRCTGCGEGLAGSQRHESGQARDQ